MAALRWAARARVCARADPAAMGGRAAGGRRVGPGAGRRGGGCLHGERGSGRYVYDASFYRAASSAECRQAGDLLPLWSALMFGPVAETQPEAAAAVLGDELAEARMTAALGLARVSTDAGPARNAVERCVG